MHAATHTLRGGKWTQAGSFLPIVRKRLWRYTRQADGEHARFLFKYPLDPNADCRLDAADDVEGPPRQRIPDTLRARKGFRLGTTPAGKPPVVCARQIRDE